MSSHSRAVLLVGQSDAVRSMSSTNGPPQDPNCLIDGIQSGIAKTKTMFMYESSFLGRQGLSVSHIANPVLRDRGVCVTAHVIYCIGVYSDLHTRAKRSQPRPFMSSTPAQKGDGLVRMSIRLCVAPTRLASLAFV